MIEPKPLSRSQWEAITASTRNEITLSHSVALWIQEVLDRHNAWDPEIPDDEELNSWAYGFRKRWWRSLKCEDWPFGTWEPTRNLDQAIACVSSSPYHLETRTRQHQMTVYLVDPESGERLSVYEGFAPTSSNKSDLALRLIQELYRMRYRHNE